MSTQQKDTYYEIWSQIAASARYYRVIAVGLLFAFLTMLFLVIRLGSRPPMVIRIDSQGNPAIVQARKDSAISVEEIQNFVTYFVEYWRGWDFYRYDEYFTRVFNNMMTQDMIKTANTELEKNSTIQNIKDNQLRYKIRLSQIVIKSVGKRYVVVEVSGQRDEGAYRDTTVKRINFIATINMIIVPRTISPWGLLVDKYEERTFD